MGNLSIAHSLDEPQLRQLQNLRLLDASSREYTLPQLVYRGLLRADMDIQSDAA